MNTNEKENGGLIIASGLMLGLAMLVGTSGYWDKFIKYRGAKFDFSYLEGFPKGYVVVFENYHKVLPPVIKLINQKMPDPINFIIAGVIALAVIYQALKQNDLWPHQMAARGLGFWVFGLLEGPYILSMYADNLTRFVKTPFIATVDILSFTYSLMGAVSFLIGSTIWLILEKRGRRWVTDPSSGRLFPLLWSSKRGVLYKVAPKEQRFLEELNEARDRRTKLIERAVFIFVMLIAAGYFRNRNLNLALVTFALIAVANSVTILFREVSYRMGAQFMKGSMVQDKEAPSTTRQNTDGQKVHGYTEEYSEYESRSNLNDKRR